MTTTLPNILLILTDDQGAWALGAAGNREIVTPHLDRLAESGIRFENFFCVSPVCSPARASLLTGRIPSQHGVHDWIQQGNLEDRHMMHLPGHVFAGDTTAIEYLAGIPAYTDILAQHGYICGLAGKWHMGDSLKPQKSFSYWEVIPYGGSAYFNGPVIEDGRVRLESRYLTDVITEKALAFLEQRPAEQPFYLSVHYTAPHSPWNSDQHPQDLRDLYADCPFESAPDLPVHPRQINSVPRGTGERRRELLTGYYAAISGVDRGVGQILAWLDEHGLRENTLVIFTGDNGMNMGHHGLWGKGNGTFPANMYEESVKVPAIIAGAGFVPGGQVSRDLLSHYDVFPTLLDYLGLPNSQAGALPGRSFAPLLRGQALDERGPVVVFDEYGPTRMIRSQRWKYIHRYPYGPHELYDLENDPGEAANLIEEASTIEIATELNAQLAEWFVRYADPYLDGSREAVTGKGQLGRPGPAGAGKPAFGGGWWYVDENGKRITNNDE